MDGVMERRIAAEMLALLQARGVCNAVEIVPVDANFRMTERGVDRMQGVDFLADREGLPWDDFVVRSLEPAARVLAACLKEDGDDWPRVLRVKPWTRKGSKGFSVDVAAADREMADA